MNDCLASGCKKDVPSSHFEHGNQERRVAAREGAGGGSVLPLIHIQIGQAKTISQYWEYRLELQNDGPDLIIYWLQEQETVVNCCNYHGQQGHWKRECPVCQNKTSLPKRPRSPVVQSFPALWAALNVTIILLDIYPRSGLPLGCGDTVTMGKDWGCLWEGKASRFQGFLGFALCWTSTVFFFIFLACYALKFYYKQLEEI